MFIEPLTEADVPIRKLREFLNGVLIPRINEITPIPDGPVQYEAGGVRVKRDESAGGYLPPFSPSLGAIGTDAGRGLTITPGYLHGPKSDGTDHEIPQYQQSAYMPQINDVDLDAETPEQLSLPAGATHYVCLVVNLLERTTVVGATTVGSVTGVRTEESGGGEAAAEIDALAYHVDTATNKWPSFQVFSSPTYTDWPADTLLVKYLPFGKYVISATGEATTSEWYWTGHRSLYPENYYRGGNSTADNTANPNTT